MTISVMLKCEMRLKPVPAIPLRLRLLMGVGKVRECGSAGLNTCKMRE